MNAAAMLRIRRARREDFPAVRELLAAGGAVAAPPSLYRLFRRTIADLTQEFYVAERAGAVLAAMGIGYRRVLCEWGQRAAIEELLWRPPMDEEIAGELLELAVARARKRGCRSLRVAPCAGLDDWGGALRAKGFVPAGQVWAKEVTAKV